MDFISPVFDLYTDYLIVNQGQTTATGLEALLEGKLKHDSVTRALSEKDYNSKDLWIAVKKFVRQIQTTEGVLILDDTIEEKAYMEENDIICWHHDHCQKRTLKGINQLTAIYYSQQVSLPVGYEIVTKTKWVKEAKTGKDKRISAVTKQERFRRLISQSMANELMFSYILADSWFCSAENINFIDKSQRLFIMPLKTNRKIALSQADKSKGKYQLIESLDIEAHQVLPVYVDGVDLPLYLTLHVFQNKDGSQGMLYLLTNDSTADAEKIHTIYRMRWKVEEFYKSVKSNTGYGKSPAHRVRTQSNHLFLSMLAFAKLEALKVSTKMNHFAIKSLLTLNALKRAWQGLQNLKANNSLLNYYA
jgi:Transposase DDE domain